MHIFTKEHHPSSSVKTVPLKLRLLSLWQILVLFPRKPQLPMNQPTAWQLLLLTYTVLFWSNNRETTLELREVFGYSIVKHILLVNPTAHTPTRPFSHLSTRFSVVLDSTFKHLLSSHFKPNSANTTANTLFLSPAAGGSGNPGPSCPLAAESELWAGAAQKHPRGSERRRAQRVCEEAETMRSHLEDIPAPPAYLTDNQNMWEVRFPSSSSVKALWS